MNRFGMWFRNLMVGRYGSDNLNRFLMIVAMVVIILNMFLRLRILSFAILVLLIYAYCRMFSRNINARYRENQKFLQLTAKFRRGSGGYGSGNYGSGNTYDQSSYGGYAGNASSGSSSANYTRPKKDKTRKILRCPVCGEKLRVPKGAGKINISCPHCGNKFIKKV